MPVGPADSFPADVGRVYLWCRVLGATDSTSVTHVWLYQGKHMAAVELPVKSANWRTWSYKTILPQWSGAWEARILDSAGEVLKVLPFTIGPVWEPKPQSEAVPGDSIGSPEP